MSMHPRWKKIALQKHSRLRFPQAITLIRWIFAFIDSATASVALCSTALRAPSRCFRTIRAARTMGSSLFRKASAAHASYALRAHAPGATRSAIPDQDASSAESQASGCSSRPASGRPRRAADFAPRCTPCRPHRRSTAPRGSGQNNPWRSNAISPRRPDTASTRPSPPSASPPPAPSAACLSLATTSSVRCRSLFERVIWDSSWPLGPRNALTAGGPRQRTLVSPYTLQEQPPQRVLCDKTCQTKSEERSGFSSHLREMSLRNATQPGA